MGNRQVLAVHGVGHNRLRVERIFQVDTLVIAPAAVEGLLIVIRAVEDDVARIRFQTGRLEKKTERNSGPFANRAPPLHAVVPCDLRSRRQPLEIG